MPRKKKAAESTPAAGHNSAGVTAQVFNKHLARIEAAEDICKKANVTRLFERKSARAAGILLGEFDAMRKVAGLPRAEQIDKLTSARDYLIYLHSPLGEQMQLNFDAIDPMSEDDAAATKRIEADAESDGYRAGLAGVLWEKDNPHELLSTSGQAWLKGYRDGQDNKAEALGDEGDSRA